MTLNLLTWLIIIEITLPPLAYYCCKFGAHGVLKARNEFAVKLFRSTIKAHQERKQNGKEA